MSKNPKEGGLCWHCRKPAAEEDRFCRFCGSGLTGFPWYYQHWGIIFLTLLALGPFSLVLVWRSPLLSRTTQWVYTVVLVAGTYYIGAQAYHTWQLVSGLLTGTSPLHLGL